MNSVVKKKILAVDDDPNVLGFLREALRQDYAFMFAKNGQEALEKAASNLPDLILLDLDLGNESRVEGLEVCRKLKENPATHAIPIIFVTGKIDADVETEGFALGAVDYITKPPQVEVLLARVQTHLSLVNVKHLENSYLEAIQMIGKAAHYNDAQFFIDTGLMQNYLQIMAEKFADEISDISLLKLASTIYDVGKVGVSSVILNKRQDPVMGETDRCGGTWNELSEEDWEQFRKHPYIAEKLLDQSPAPVFKMACKIALNIHENFDGSGYPNGKSGKEIPFEARLVAVIETFTSLTCKQSYREAWDFDKTLSYILTQKGKRFDPEIVDQLSLMMPYIEKTHLDWLQNQPSADI